MSYFQFAARALYHLDDFSVWNDLVQIIVPQHCFERSAILRLKRVELCLFHSLIYTVVSRPIVRALPIVPLQFIERRKLLNCDVIGVNLLTKLFFLRDHFCIVHNRIPKSRAGLTADQLDALVRNL